MRAFLAIPLPDEIRRGLARLQARMRDGLPGVRWVRPETLHVTIVFLGEVDDAIVAALAEEARLACREIPAGEARLGGLGCYPKRGPARVLWCGIEESDGPLAALHHALSLLAGGHGIETEARRFSPHLTLGRARSPLPRALVEAALTSSPLEDLGTIPVDRCNLYRSVLSPDGARHELHTTLELGKARREER